MNLTVCETFISLMGESTLAGLPAFFIRLSGCNLRCTYCDTTYAYEGGGTRSVASLVEAARSSSQKLVLVTGGEPLLQKGTRMLLEGLIQAGLDVMVETNGSLPIAGLDCRLRRVVDIKCPGSGMSSRNLWANLEILTPRDEVKFILSDQDDFNWALGVAIRYRLLDRLPVLMSPAFGVLPPSEVAAWIIKSERPLRLNLQLHKYIWGPETRGV
jgi:7-carboxy-7-deazaguanine synthase|uniref:7-carboxy-7-deazaguanine synthase n=1 Tax=Desulfobacca acetoxidans TaxID=60893 RepID=A0A7V6DNR6_9BACT